MDSFDSHSTLQAGGQSVRIARLSALAAAGHDLDRLPFSLKILLENLLRREDGKIVPAADIEALLAWDSKAEPATEIAFMPARVLLQDFTGVPAIVDLAALRDAMHELGGDPKKINPLQPAELVIDHSVQVDEYGSDAAFLLNVEREFQRNGERYAFLRWGQSSFDNFRVVPPGTGIVHQINIEYLARVIMTGEGDTPWAYPDTLVGTDSHTTMVNGLGVLGWGVGGIEAEAAMLGQPVSMLIPQVVGFRLVGELAEGATATDLVLTVTEMLRAHGVVGKFVEYFGPGLAGLPLADRATIANMAPEYGATCGIFPIDNATLDYLRLTGRSQCQIELVEAYAREQGMFHTADTPEAEYSDTMELDLSTVQPSLAGPKRPQDRIALGDVKDSFLAGIDKLVPPGRDVQVDDISASLDGQDFSLNDGSLVIAAITSCTNTSNPSVMVGAGLLAKNAVARGLTRKPWVKTSLAPGSKVVTRYLERAGLMEPLEALGFHLVGYGCTTCIGNSGPLPEPIREAIHQGDLVTAAILSGNRNFEGRISPDIRANYLASPPLVVAFALAGRIDVDVYNEPLEVGSDGQDVYLRDIWPSQSEIAATVADAVRGEMFSEEYAGVFDGDEQWNSLEIPSGDTYSWAPDSTYIKLPPFFQGIGLDLEPTVDIEGARCLALLGNSVTTDHISPAGAIKVDSPAGHYLTEHGVSPRDFNSYGSRRGNHEVMMRGTFGNVRLRNLLVPGVEGGFTRYLPTNESTSIYDAAMRYQEDGTPLVVIAGTEYGTGSSRDWAAKGSALLGIKAVITASYERIHRSNLIGMGVLPLEFLAGESATTHGLTGEETFAIQGLAAMMNQEFKKGTQVTVSATNADGETKSFPVQVRLDTPQEAEYYRHGGILTYVLRHLAAGERS